MIQSCASGKFILIGEHFVISGVPAIAYPLHGLKCEVQITPSESGQLEVSAQVHGSDILTIHENMKQTIRVASHALSLNELSMQILGKSNFPVSRGFGSSAAFSVALIQALAEFRKQRQGIVLGGDEFNSATLEIEKLFHGMPSGVDTAVITHGNGIRFELKKKRVTSLSQPFDVIAIDSGARDQCSVMVKRVSLMPAFEELTKEMKELVFQCEQALLNGNYAQLAYTVNRAHEVLRELGLSTRPIERIREVALKLGALACKVSGAGCGGAVIVLTEPGCSHKIANRLKDDFDVLTVQPGGANV